MKTRDKEQSTHILVRIPVDMRRRLDKAVEREGGKHGELQRLLRLFIDAGLCRREGMSASDRLRERRVRRALTMLEAMTADVKLLLSNILGVAKEIEP